MKGLPIVIALTVLLFAAGCEVEDPIREDVPELITKVTLTFTPTVGDPVVVTATDPDEKAFKMFRWMAISNWKRRKVIPCP